MKDFLDLGNLYDQIRSVISSKTYREIELPQVFKSQLSAIGDRTIVYHKYTAIAYKKNADSIIIPNYWFYLATDILPFNIELHRYYDQIVSMNLFTTNRLNGLKNSSLSEDEKKKIESSFESKQDVERICRFLTDYRWWHGGKELGRGQKDYFVSAVLSLSGLINDSSSFLASICEVVREKPELSELLVEYYNKGNSNQAIPNKIASQYIPFVTAIKSKPFLLLAGISGTGKSRIVRELAFMTCPEKLQDEDGTTPGNYCMIEVKPNWHDSTELLGYYSSFNGGGYRFTKFDRFVIKAWLNPTVPFFVCLDEMNLAPVEQYFAEFLSVLETRSRDNEGNVVTGALVDKQYFKDDTKMKEDLGLDGADDWTIKVRSDLVNKGLTLPPNLIVIGTVNMDDTTYQFSRKVIDRAMTIEMNGGELSQMFGNSKSLKYSGDENVVKLEMFKAPYINADEVIESYQSQAHIIKEKLPEKLEAINTSLKDTPFQVSYRVLNELVIYLGALMDEATAKGESIDDDTLPTLIDQATDQITLMKILPRIEGDEDMFRRSGGANVLKTLQSLFSEDSDSYRKLEEMADRLNRTGFTRFWP